MKSKKWCLVPLNGDTNEHFLNIGETKIGRSPDADVNVTSVFCSRAHCVISLSSDDGVSILIDSVSQ